MDTIDCIRSLMSAWESYEDVLLLCDNSDDTNEVEKVLSFLAQVGSPRKQDCSQKSIDYIFRYERIIYFKSKSNLGFAKANNCLLSYVFNDLQSEISWIWFLNNDTLVDPIDYSSIHTYASNTKCNLLYSQINTFDNQYESDGLHYINLVTSTTTNVKKICYTPYICGASLLLRYSKSIPLWNEAYFLYYEDIDYYFTLKQMGYIAEQIPNAKILHKVSASTKKVRTINMIKIRSQSIFMKKYAKSYLAYFVLRCIHLLALSRIAEFKNFINIAREE